MTLYLCRSECTDTFKEALDFLDAALGQLSCDNPVHVLILGANPGAVGDPLATTGIQCLNRDASYKQVQSYLCGWNYLSLHLYTSSPVMLNTSLLPNICCPDFGMFCTY